MEGARLFDIKTFKQITEHSIYMDGTIKDKIKNNLESLLNVRIIETDFDSGKMKKWMLSP